MEDKVHRAVKIILELSFAAEAFHPDVTKSESLSNTDEFPLSVYIDCRRALSRDSGSAGTVIISSDDFWMQPRGWNFNSSAPPDQINRGGAVTTSKKQAVAAVVLWLAAA